MSNSDIFKGVGVPVKLTKKENYLVVKETLERIGVSPKNKKVLYQSCHIVHKNDSYIIAHFKELFKLDKSDYPCRCDNIIQWMFQRFRINKNSIFR